MNKIKITIFIISIIAIYSCNSANTSDKKNTNTTLKDTTKVEESICEIPDIHKKYLLGQINPETDTMFVAVPAKYCLMRTEYMHRDALDPYIQMYEAAKLEGINLGLISAFRSFDTQNWLWSQKFNPNISTYDAAQSVLRYVAMPGTSRHHWGTDIDVLQTKLNYFETTEGQKAYKWMCENAPKYGFYQVYTKGRSTGYYEEKWHWSYMPVAGNYQKQYLDKISYDDLTGFKGSNVAKDLKVIDNYVFGIDSLLLDQ